ncbi:MAG: ATP-binding cassette domain-containing protein [Rhodospirillales bacterium]|nr:ATP-binding cassette domain-containing protein [Rhodospirillales bacterium]
MSDPAVVLDDVHLTLTSKAGPVNILRGVTFTARRDESIAVLGPSGAGKSTLLAIIAGLERADRGQVIVGGTDIGGLGESALAGFRRGAVGIVFQAFHLIPTMTALENVALPLELGTHANPFRAAREALETVGLGNRLQHYPSQLSGGEQQRVAMARAFVPQPDVLLADEPTGNLDGETGGAVMGELFRLRAERGSTLILVTHDHALAAQCDRTVHIADGRIVAPAEG